MRPQGVDGRTGWSDAISPRPSARALHSLLESCRRVGGRGRSLAAARSPTPAGGAGGLNLVWIFLTSGYGSVVRLRIDASHMASLDTSHICSQKTGSNAPCWIARDE